MQVWPTPSAVRESAWWNGRSGPVMHFLDRTLSLVWPTRAQEGRFVSKPTAQRGSGV